MSLSDYLLREITWLANRLTWDEYFDLVDREGPLLRGEPPDTVELTRELREERERELEARTIRTFERE